MIKIVVAAAPISFTPLVMVLLKQHFETRRSFWADYKSNLKVLFEVMALQSS